MNREIRDAVGAISRMSGLGDNTTTMQNLFYGVNHRGIGNPVPTNTDHYGLTFFSRPRLNLSYHNVLGVRKMHPLLNTDDGSLAKACRAYLDPVSNRNEIYAELGGENNPDAKSFMDRYDVVETPLVDPLFPFMPLLTNTLISLSGWPDLVGDTFTSNEGLAREQYSIIDGIGKIFTTFDLTANFRNVAGDPITLLITSWLLYALSVRQGEMVPWPSSIAEREIDYTTRIYRLVLDPTRNFVKKIAACGAAFPTNSSIGAAFNFNGNIPVAEENREIPVQFRCMGADYNDPILVEEFNRLVQNWNPNMRPSNPNTRNSEPIGLTTGKYVAVKNKEKNYLNYRGYPQINTDTMELTWYVPVTELEGL